MTRIKTQKLLGRRISVTSPVIVITAISTFTFRAFFCRESLLVFPNQRPFISTRKSLVKGYPDIAPSTESIAQSGHNTVPSSSHSVTADGENIFRQEKQPQSELFCTSSRL